MTRKAGNVLVLMSSLFLWAMADQHGKDQKLLAQAGDYIVAYERAFANIVAEEDYLQKLTRDCRHYMNRRLRSDILLVWSVPDAAWVAFRDTFQVDDELVRERRVRLERLFLAQSPDLGRISDESARYNLGRVVRNFNIPMMALTFLHPANQPRCAYKVHSPKQKDGLRLVKIDFSEEASPTIVRSGETDLFARGEFWVEADSGAVRRSKLVVGGIHAAVPQATIEVEYDRPPGLDLLVPVKMREKYKSLQKPCLDQVDAWATYANFRRFTVQVEQEIRRPDEDDRP